MKILLILLAVLFLTGCAEGFIKASSDRDATLYNAQNASKSMEIAERIALANIPACRLEAAENQTITLGGVKVFECYGGVFVTGADDNAITQRQSGFWPWMHSQGNNVFGAITMCLVFGACGLGGTGALPSVGPSPEVIQIPTQVIDQPTVIFAP